jgi:hypothetical protein
LPSETLALESDVKIAASLDALVGHVVEVFYPLADPERWLDERQAAQP